MNKRELLDIVFHPQGYALQTIQDMVRDGILEKSQIAAIFDAGTAETLLGMSAAISLPPSTRRHATDASFNHVVIWGVKESGKTAVIGSLLSLKGFRALKSKKEPADARTLALQELFRSQQSLQVMPTDQNDKEVEFYPTLYYKNIVSKRYPIQLVEALLGTPLEGVVKKDSEQVHIICIDCRQNLNEQARKIERLLSELSENGHLDHTNGIYLLVTKTDLMQAPRDYQENAAQTLVTSSMPGLWQKIRNICYTKHIYNAMPIPFSAGDFVLKDVVILDPRDSECVMREALLPKCHARHTWIGRLLSKGKRWHAVMATIAAIIAVGYGSFLAYEAIQKPPTTPVRPYNYKQDFMTREQEMRGATLSRSEALYNELSNDLAVEYSLHDTNGKNILSASDHRACESQLTNDFAKTVAKETAHVFSAQDWSQDENRLNKLNSLMKELMEHDCMTNNDLAEYNNYIDDYYNKLKPLLRKSETCSSMDDVNEVTENCGEWKKYPYNNDSLLNERIKQAPAKAYESLARSYENRAKNKLDQLMERLGWANGNPYSQGVQQYMSKMRRIFKDETSDLLDSIDELIDEIGESSEYNSVREKLLNTRRSLTNDYE